MDAEYWHLKQLDLRNIIVEIKIDYKKGQFQWTKPQFAVKVYACASVNLFEISTSNLVDVLEWVHFH